jgi:hypothetical protein
MPQASPDTSDTEPSCFACKAVSTVVLLGTSGYFLHLARSKATNTNLQAIKASPRFLYFMSAGKDANLFFEALTLLVAAMVGAVANWVVRDGKKDAIERR